MKRILPILTTIAVCACNVPTGYQAQDNGVGRMVLIGIALVVGIPLAIVVGGVCLIALAKRIWTGSW